MPLVSLRLVVIFLLRFNVSLTCKTGQESCPPRRIVVRIKLEWKGAWNTTDLGVVAVLSPPFQAESSFYLLPITSAVTRCRHTLLPSGPPLAARLTSIPAVPVRHPHDARRSARRRGMDEDGGVTPSESSQSGRRRKPKMAARGGGFASVGLKVQRQINSEGQGRESSWQR